ncbi:SDR family oxidoreductase [Streptomyces sp. I05A-00742]|uniref:SDR family oxidoreductase n=1 Tax=Streptomyces sp. I05A-00742 TaxID=2732853 RepID=UPI001487F18A|nr:SDR family oxidoreductase [Streptomyces sp. I05A-00742]
MSVVITGSTGFLGLHLIRELLGRHPALTLLTRAGSPPALPRVLRFLEHGGMPENELRLLPRRLSLVEGDVTLPLLGLPEPVFRRLADSVDVLWHCAADISLSPTDAAVRTRNVAGTRNVLRLLEAGPPRAVLAHASTFAVAGAQQGGIVPEAPLTGDSGFNSPYEESKFLSELLIHRWCAHHRRGAAVFRLPGLITDAPAYPGRPEHPLATVAAVCRAALRAHPEVIGPDGTVRLPGTNPDAVINYLPVEHVARVMAETVDRALPAHGAYIQHITHPAGTPVGTFLSALTRGLGGRPVFVPDPLPPASAAQRAAGEMWGRFLPFMAGTRRYETARTRAMGLDWPADAPLDEAYLVRSLA